MSLRSPTPPRLPEDSRRAVFPSFTLGCALMVMLPLAQCIEPHVQPKSSDWDIVVHPIPEYIAPPVEPPAPPKDDTVIDPPEPERTPPRVFPIVVDPRWDLSGYGGVAVSDWAGFDQDDLDRDIEDWRNLTVKPVPAHQPAPTYPSTLRSSRVEGDVRVQYLIRANGTVSRVRILSSDHPDFSEAVERALRKWTFQPGERDGRSVAVWVVQTLPFRIND